MGNFLLHGMVMIRIYERFLLGDISKNEQIQFSGLQMQFPVIVTPLILNFSATMVQYTGLRKNSKIFCREYKPLGVHRNMEGCIVEVNFE